MQELKSLGGQECSVSYITARVCCALGRAGRGAGIKAGPLAWKISSQDLLTFGRESLEDFLQDLLAIRGQPLEQENSCEKIR